jgi:predicted Zn-dependent protease
MGGTVPATETGATETWNGTSWTEVTDLNTARDNSEQSGNSNCSFSSIWKSQVVQ